MKLQALGKKEVYVLTVPRQTLTLLIGHHRHPCVRQAGFMKFDWLGGGAGFRYLVYIHTDKVLPFPADMQI